MPRIAYRSINFRAGTLSIINKAAEICAEYAAQGYDLTLRQLYYQFVSRNLIANKQSEYSRLGDIVSDARLAGLLDWNYISDRGRNVGANSHWDSPGDIIGAAADGYRIDRWADQEYHIEVWVEKQALESVISRVAIQEDVAWLACKGYMSSSEMWAASQRFIRQRRKSGKIPVIIHLGDHDPSGIDMSRDIEDRLVEFGCSYVEVDRIALNMDQVERYNPPPNPAKETDSRCTGYMQRFGDESWELDALEPSVLTRLITNAIRKRRDNDKYREAVDREKREKRTLRALQENWADVSTFVEDNFLSGEEGAPEAENYENYEGWEEEDGEEDEEEE